MKLHYFQSPNFGDALSPLLVAKLSGEKVEWADAYEADMVAVGSVMYAGHWLYREGKYASTLKGRLSYWKQKVQVRRAPIKVWGTGIMQDSGDYAPVKRLREIDIHALRGRITHDILKRLGLLTVSHATVYGDPGLLYSMLLDEMPEKKFVLGLIPHYVDREKGHALCNVLKAHGVDVALIDVMNPDPVETLRQISSCETILSSSMHGCIVSDGMGIPNRQLYLSDYGIGKEDSLLKFRDYYSAFGMELPTPAVESDVTAHIASIDAWIKKEYSVSQEVVARTKASVLAAFPRR